MGGVGSEGDGVEVWKGREEGGEVGGKGGEDGLLVGEEGGVVRVGVLVEAQDGGAGRGRDERRVPREGLDEVAEVAAASDVLYAGEAGRGGVKGQVPEEKLRTDVCKVFGGKAVRWEVVRGEVGRDECVDLGGEMGSGHCFRVSHSSVQAAIDTMRQRDSGGSRERSMDTRGLPCP